MRSLAKQHEVIAHPRAMGGDYDRDACRRSGRRNCGCSRRAVRSAEPLDEKTLAARMPTGPTCAPRSIGCNGICVAGVNLVRIAGKWTFRTAATSLAAARTRSSLASFARRDRDPGDHRLPSAGHPAEIEEIRGVSASRGTLDVLLETGWIRPRGRRKAPGRRSPSDHRRVLSHFGLDSIRRSARSRRAQGHGAARRPAAGGLCVPVPSDDLNLGRTRTRSSPEISISASAPD